MLKYLIIIMGFYSNLSCAQQTGRIYYKSLGISFTIPAKWVGQETEMGYIMSSNTTAGFILLTKNETIELATMITEAQQGVSDGNGNYLQLLGSVEVMEADVDVIGGEYEGVLEGQSARAYILGVANTFGSGFSIMAATTTEFYSGIYKQLCFDLANSVEIDVPEEPVVIQNSEPENKSEPEKPWVMNDWEKEFSDAKLSYYDSYSSGGYGSYGGYSTKIIIELCGQGFFTHSSQSSMSVSAGGSSGYSGDGGNGAGTWKIIENGDEAPILRLTFYNGELYEYYITLDGTKTFLDGYRYFRTYGEDGAYCSY